eukprot:403371081
MLSNNDCGLMSTQFDDDMQTASFTMSSLNNFMSFDPFLSSTTSFDLQQQQFQQQMQTKVNSLEQLEQLQLQHHNSRTENVFNMHYTSPMKLPTHRDRFFSDSYQSLSHREGQYNQMYQNQIQDFLYNSLCDQNLNQDFMGGLQINRETLQRKQSYQVQQAQQTLDYSHNNFSIPSGIQTSTTSTNVDTQSNTGSSFKTKYKTEICRNWELHGTCKFGDTCAFAHGDFELQKKSHVPSKYKTKLCKQYHENLYCPYGQRCQFAHSQRSFQDCTTSASSKNDSIEIDSSNGFSPSEKTSKSESSTRKVSYKQMLDENMSQMMTRLKNSQNPEILEFNVVYKQRPRLDIFQQMTKPQQPKCHQNIQNFELQSPDKRVNMQMKHNQDFNGSNSHVKDMCCMDCCSDNKDKISPIKRRKQTQDYENLMSSQNMYSAQKSDRKIHRVKQSPPQQKSSLNSSDSEMQLENENKAKTLRQMRREKFIRSNKLIKQMQKTHKFLFLAHQQQESEFQEPEQCNTNQLTSNIRQISLINYQDDQDQC